MACLICGRGACCSSFHSLEEQEAYEGVHARCELEIERLKDRIEELEGELKGLDG